MLSLEELKKRNDTGALGGAIFDPNTKIGKLASDIRSNYQAGMLEAEKTREASFGLKPAIPKATIQTPTQSQQVAQTKIPVDKTGAAFDTLDWLKGKYMNQANAGLKRPTPTPAPEAEPAAPAAVTPARDAGMGLPKYSLTDEENVAIIQKNRADYDKALESLNAYHDTQEAKDNAARMANEELYQATAVTQAMRDLASNPEAVAKIGGMKPIMTEAMLRQPTEEQVGKAKAGEIGAQQQLVESEALLAKAKAAGFPATFTDALQADIAKIRASHAPQDRLSQILSAFREKKTTKGLTGEEVSTEGIPEDILDALRANMGLPPRKRETSNLPKPVF